MPLILAGDGRVTPEAYYSNADAGDWLPAMLRAQTAASVIYLGPTTYECSSAITNVSNKTWIGAGQSSILKNIQNVGLNSVYRAAFTLGNIHPAQFLYVNPTSGKLLSYDLNAVSANDASVQLTTAGQYTNFSVGQFVAVRHITEVSANGNTYPLYAQYTKVTAVTAGGLITLADPIFEAISSACISPIGARTDPFTGLAWNFVENVNIANMTIDAYNIAWTRTGAYNCAIRNIWGLNMQAPMSINAFVNSVVDGVTADFTDRFCEVKCYSQRSTFANMSGSLIGAGSVNAIVDVGEQSNRILLKNITAATTASDAGAREVMQLTGFKNTARNCTITQMTSDHGQPCWTIPGSPFTVYPPDNNQIIGGSYVVNAGFKPFIGIIGSSGSATNPSNYTIDGVSMSGTTTTPGSMKVAAGGVGGILKNSTMAGALQILGGATTPAETNNTYV